MRKLSRNVKIIIHSSDSENEMSINETKYQNCYFENISKGQDVDNEVENKKNSISIEQNQRQEVDIIPQKPQNTSINNNGFNMKDKIKQENLVHFPSSSYAIKNKFITYELERLQNYYKQKQDKGRSIAYQRAVQAINTVDKVISTENDVEMLPYIGKKMKCKILEIIKTGHSSKARNLTFTQEFQIIQNFNKVWGIGPKKARELYDSGVNSIEELQKNNQHLLNSSQKIGLKYYEEFQQKIPRKESEQIFQIVFAAIQSIQDYENQFIVVPCGSYRRGVEYSGDVDILISQRYSHKKTKGNFLQLLINFLSSEEQNGFLTDHLQLPHNNFTIEKSGNPTNYIEKNLYNNSYYDDKYSHSSNFSSTYMGVCKLPNGIHRRIDIKVYPKEYFGFALIHFTGSKNFNASLRLNARKNKNLLLNDRGFFEISNSNKNLQQINVVCPDERSVFRYLGIEYKDPSERNL